MTRNPLLLSTIGLMAACAPELPKDPTTTVLDSVSEDEDYQGPGSEVWGDEDISCEIQDDCLVGESCLDSVCQPSQCEGGLSESKAPIGSSFQFFADNEIGIVDQASWSGSYWIDGFEPTAAGTDYTGSWEVGGSALIDLTGGRFDKADTATWAAAIEGRNSLAFATGDDVNWISLGFMPVALDAGDTDSDGFDEVAVISEDGRLALCSMDTMSCTTITFSDGISLEDVAVGDVDEDAVSEIVLLMEYEGEDYLYVVNLDWEETGQPETWQTHVGDLSRIASGDMNGDRIAEIVGLKDVNSWPFVDEDDELIVYNVAPPETPDDTVGQIVEMFIIEANDRTDLMDIDVKDTDANTIAELYAVDSDTTINAYDLRESGLALRHSTTLGSVSEPHRIALADSDGNSPRATLKEGPILCKGAPIPGTVILMPPYDKDHSSGPAGSFYGAGEQTSEEYSDTVSLGLNMDIGINADFTAIFSATLNESVSWRTTKTYSERSRKYVGGRYGMTADPDTYGPYHGAVALHWGCFDAYVYEIEDPQGLVSDDAQGETFVLTVPVGGAVSVWSIARYNAMAEAVGHLPVIDVPYEVGVVEDYPQDPETIEGEAIPEEDLIFPDEQWFVAPDVGSISFWRSIDEDTSERTALNTSLGVSASITVAGVKVGGGAEMGWGQGYSLSIGKSAVFAGSVKAVADDPSTPEDEYELYTYRFSPLVYRQWYENGDGDESAFYVMTYTAER